MPAFNTASGPAGAAVATIALAADGTTVNAPTLGAVAAALESSAAVVGSASTAAACASTTGTAAVRVLDPDRARTVAAARGTAWSDPETRADPTGIAPAAARTRVWLSEPAAAASAYRVARTRTGVER